MTFIETLEQAVNSVLNPVSSFIWGWILTYLLLGPGWYSPSPRASCNSACCFIWQCWYSPKKAVARA